MTTETVSAGWFLAGIFATLVIAALCWLLRDLWSEYVAQAAVATVAETPEARCQRLFDAQTDVSLDLAAHTVAADDRLRVVGDVVPFQRTARADS